MEKTNAGRHLPENETGTNKMLGIQQKTPPGNNNKRDLLRPQKAFQDVKQHSWKQK